MGSRGEAVDLREEGEGGAGGLGVLLCLLLFTTEGSSDCV